MSLYTKPITGECTEYFEGYLSHLAQDSRDVLVILEQQALQIQKGLQNISDQLADHRYEPNKWSVKEVIGHLIDTERLFAFRALWIARSETNVQPGMDENLWATSSNAHSRDARDIAEEFVASRTSHLHLFRSFDEEAISRKGLSAGTNTTVNVIPWLMAAHERHHLKVLSERYGVDFLGSQ